MKFSQVIRWLAAGLLLVVTWAILLERWAWNKIPTQIAVFTVYTVVGLNVVTMVVLVVKPSVLGLSTKTDKN